MTCPPRLDGGSSGPDDGGEVSDKRVALIGLGNMGSGMVRRLLSAGYTVTVHNRTPEKATPLMAAGALRAASASEAAASHDLVVLSLGDETAVEQVTFGELVPVLAPGSTVIDTSTVSVGYAVEAHARLAVAGLRGVEARVLGNPAQAAAGELRIFTGGAEPPAGSAVDVLAVLGSEVRHLGQAGAASTAKLVFNLILGTQVAALAEAVNYGVAAGLDREQLLSSIAGSGFSSMVMNFRTELMRRRSYEPAQFRSHLMAKDLRAALGGPDPAYPVLTSVLARFTDVVAAGDGDKDAAVLIEHTR
jgi:3-hydroxyisobutyrate dehydrogenase-like beta-hydroxyacid dehydrogenase